MKDSIMPQAIESEMAVLGCIIRNEKLLADAEKYIINKDMFYDSGHQRLFQIIKKLKNDSKPIDPVIICSMITANDKKKHEILDTYYITGLLEEGIDSRVESYARVVAEKYYQRELIKDSERIQNYCLDNNVKYEDIIKKVNVITSNLQSLNTGKDFDLKTLITDTNNAISEPLNLINYGFSSLNHLAGGMTRGEVSVIAGRPGHGKTTFMINLVFNLLKQGYKVMVINREMTNTEMMKKLLVLASGKLSYSVIRSGKIDDQTQIEINRIFKEILNQFNKKLIMFDDVFSLQESSAVINKHRPDIVLDDYLQLIRVGGTYDARRFEIEAIMTEYKMIAKKHNLVAIVLSQLNRNIEQRIDPIPKLSDLAESGSIEAVAENILFLYYDYHHMHENSEYGAHRNQIVAAKVRYGTTGRLIMGFDGNKCLFHENVTEFKQIPRKKTIEVSKKILVEDTQDIFKRLAKHVD